MKATTEELIDALSDTVRSRKGARLSIDITHKGIEVTLSAGVRGFVYAAELEDGEQAPGESVRANLAHLLAELSTVDLDLMADPVKTAGDFVTWEPRALLGMF